MPKLSKKALTFSALLWAVALAMGAELAVRQWVKPPVALVTRDKELGWRFLPNRRIPMYTPEGERFLTTNSTGFRGREHVYNAGEKKLRVLVLGDSYVAGTAYPDETLFTNQLERELGAEAHSVYNAGISAWSTDQEVRFLIGEAYQRIAPDMVILVVAPNDFREAHAKRAYVLPKEGTLEWLGFPAPPLHERFFWWGLNHSALVQAVAAKLNRNDVFKMLKRRYAFTFPIASLSGRNAGDADLFLKQVPDELQQSRRLFEALVKLMRNHAPSQILLTVLPTKLEFEWPVNTGELHQAGLISEYVKGYARTEGFPFLDLWPKITKAGGKELFIDEEYHLNEKGHAFLARELAEFVRREKNLRN